MNSRTTFVFILVFLLGLNSLAAAQQTIPQPDPAQPVGNEALSGESSVDSIADEPVLVEEEDVAHVSTIDVLDFKNTDIRDALNEIETKTGLVIVTGSDVWGKITLSLQNIEVETALRIILEANRLAYIEENGIITVMPANEFESKYGYEFRSGVQSRIIPIVHIDPEEMVANLIPLKSKEGEILVDRKSGTIILLDDENHLSEMEQLIKETDVPMGTGVFRLRYAQVKDVKHKIEHLLTENIGRLECKESSNKIIVTDKAVKIKEIARLIEEIDRKVEVLIEAKVFQIRLIEEHKDGIDWEAIVSDYQQMDLVQKDKEESPRNMQLSMGTVTEEDYAVLLEALGTVGEVVNLSNPRTTAVINREGRINLDSNKEGQDENENTDAGAREQNSFEMQLKVKPRFEEELLVLGIKPKLRWMSIDRKSSGHWSMTTYSSQVESLVKLKSDELVVLGGLMGEREVDKLSKFPLLGDIPILGFAFRRRNKLIEKMEYVVFLTQRIVEGEETTD